MPLQLNDVARRAGAVRTDLTDGDLIPLMCGIAYAAVAHPGPRPPGVTSRCCSPVCGPDHHVSMLAAGGFTSFGERRVVRVAGADKASRSRLGILGGLAWAEWVCSVMRSSEPPAAGAGGGGC